MVENNLSDIELIMKSSCNSMVSFSRLVNDLEHLAEQNKSFFKNNISLNLFEEVWRELEIFNAYVLDIWEAAGKPSDFNEIWNAEFKKDALFLVNKIIKFFK